MSPITADVRRGQLLGREDLSTNPASPSARNRLTHR